MKRFLSDNAAELFVICTQLNSLCIDHSTSLGYTPGANAVTEQMSRTLMDETCAMLKEVGINERLRTEVVEQAAYLPNMAVSHALKIRTPQELLLRSASNNQKIRFF